FPICPFFFGDGRLATAAFVEAGGGVALGGAGNLFIADGKVIRRVDAATGTITTVEGRSDALDCSAGLDDGGPATAACLDLALGVALDGAGHLFLADLCNGRVERV